MTTFVDTSVLLTGHEASDQDPVVVVVRSAHGMLREGLGESESANFQQEFANQYSEKNWPKIFDLLLGNTIVIFKRLAVEDGNVESVARISKTAEGYFDVVLSILSKMESVEEVVERIETFINSVIDSEPKSVASVQSLKLRLLKTLLTVLSPRVQLRVTVVHGLCRFGQENPKFKSAVFALVKDTSKWIDEFEWEVSNEEKFQLYQEIVAIAESSQKIEYMRKQLECAPAANKAALAHAVEIEILNHPGYFDFASLSNSVDPQIQKCVSIYVSGSYKEMASFVASVEGSKNFAGVDLPTVLEKMRIVSIQAMATGKTRLSISAIASELAVDDPLPIIVKAMQAGLVYGAINGVEGVVEIHAVKPRSKSVNEWASVQAKLNKIVQRYHE